ncbi:MAG: hypothetical protein LBI33_14530, partial [Propionibacteriaceae bacterium]|nr:hypothetical protein [Propionibacteriaceae bacterium]
MSEQWCLGFEYVPGEGVCVAAWPWCLVTSLPPDDARLAGLAERFAQSPTLATVIDLVGTVCPSFAALVVDDASDPGAPTVKIVLHGDVRAVVDGEAASGTKLITMATLPPDADVELWGGPGE